MTSPFNFLSRPINLYLSGKRRRSVGVVERPMSRFVNLIKMFVRLSRTHYSNVTIIMAARTEVSFTKNGLLLTKLCRAWVQNCLARATASNKDAVNNELKKVSGCNKVNEMELIVSRSCLRRMLKEQSTRQIGPRSSFKREHSTSIRIYTSLTLT